MYRSYLGIRHKTIEQLPYCVGRAAGGHPACGRMLIRPPPSFKKNKKSISFAVTWIKPVTQVSKRAAVQRLRNP